jgi:hypothetical protein
MFFRYGVVHFNTYEDACIFLHTMKGKKFSGPSCTVIKFSEAKEFKTKKLIKYDEVSFAVLNFALLFLY